MNSGDVYIFWAADGRRHSSFQPARSGVGLEASPAGCCAAIGTSGYLCVLPPLDLFTITMLNVHSIRMFYGIYGKILNKPRTQIY